MSKQSPYNIPRIANATERALLLYSVFTGTQIAWCWTHLINSPAHLLWPREDSHSVIKSFHPPLQSYKSTFTHMCTHVLLAADVQGGIHLCNSACRGYFRGNLLITPNVVSQSMHTAIHQHTPICQSHSLPLVRRVLQAWELVNSSVYINVCVWCMCFIGYKKGDKS